MNIERPRQAIRPQIEMRNAYFEKEKDSQDYRLRETVYDENNRPIGIKLSDDTWTAFGATLFITKMLGGVVTTSEERIKGLK